MSFVMSVICTNCGSIKGSGNRWLLGFESSKQLECDGHFLGVELKGYAIIDWDDSALKDTSVDHYCSEKCAFTKLGERIRKDVPIGQLVDVTA